MQEQRHAGLTPRCSLIMVPIHHGPLKKKVFVTLFSKNYFSNLKNTLHTLCFRKMFRKHNFSNSRLIHFRQTCFENNVSKTVLKKHHQAIFTDWL